MSTRSAFKVEVRITASSACSIGEKISADRALSASVDCRSRRANQQTIENIDGSSDTSMSSRSVGRYFSKGRPGPCRTPLSRDEVEPESFGNRRQRLESWVWALCGEEPPNCLWSHLGASRQFRLTEIQLLAACIKSTNDTVYLLDIRTRPFICAPVPGVAQAPLKVSLRAGGLLHESRIA